MPTCSSSCAPTTPTSSATRSSAGGPSLSYAAEHITSESDDLDLLVGVDTQVVHGIVYCGAVGVITGIGNVLPDAVLTSIRLARAAAGGDPTALRLALELEQALGPLGQHRPALHHQLVVVRELALAPSQLVAAEVADEVVGTDDGLGQQDRGAGAAMPSAARKAWAMRWASGWFWQFVPSAST